MSKIETLVDVGENDIWNTSAIPANIGCYNNRRIQEIVTQIASCMDQTTSTTSNHHQ